MIDEVIKTNTYDVSIFIFLLQGFFLGGGGQIYTTPEVFKILLYLKHICRLYILTFL